MSNEENTNFTKVARKINENYEEHERNIKKFCMKSSIISVSDFYEIYENRVKDINSEITPCKDNPAISDFADIFKLFEEYPANIQKPKKPQAKELQRTNSTILKLNTPSPVLDVTCTSNTATNITNSPETRTIYDGAPSASESYSDFKEFQQKLQQLQTELQKRDTANEYATKLTQLRKFAQQLDKLVPTERAVKQAFTAKEQQALQQLAANAESLNFIESNNDIFQHMPGNVNARLDSLMDVMAYLIMSLNCIVIK